MAPLAPLDLTTSDPLPFRSRHTTPYNSIRSFFFARVSPLIHSGTGSWGGGAPYAVVSESSDIGRQVMSSAKIRRSDELPERYPTIAWLRANERLMVPSLNDGRRSLRIKGHRRAKALRHSVNEWRTSIPVGYH